MKKSKNLPNLSWAVGLMLLFATTPLHAQFIRTVTSEKKAENSPPAATDPKPSAAEKKATPKKRAGTTVAVKPKNTAEQMTQEQQKLEQEVLTLKKELKDAGVLRDAETAKLTPEQAAEKASLEAKLADVEKKLADLQAAVDRGLDPKLVETTVRDLEQQSLEIKKSIDAVKPPENLSLIEEMNRELDALRQTVASLETSLENVSKAQTSAKAAEETPVPKEETAAASPTAGYDKGFFVQSTDGAFKLKIQGRIKTLYSFESEEIADDGDRETSTSLSVPYARLALSGHLFDKRLSYLFMPEFGGGNVRLIFAYGDFGFVPNKIHLRFGLFKRPFSRNYLTSTVQKQFIESPTGNIGHGFDIGIELSNNYSKAKGFEWAVGLFNSQSNPTSPKFSGTVATADDGSQTVEGGKFSNAIDNFSPALVFRLGYNNGVKGYQLADLEGGPFRYGVAINSHTDFDVDDDNEGALFLGGDFTMKAYGFSLSGGLFVGWADEGNMWDNPSYAAVGTNIQTGYVFAERYEPVLRYGMLNPDGSNDLEQALTVGFSIYFYKQDFKLENNFTTEFLEGDSLTNFIYASQLQLLF